LRYVSIASSIAVLLLLSIERHIKTIICGATRIVSLGEQTFVALGASFVTGGGSFVTGGGMQIDNRHSQ